LTSLKRRLLSDSTVYGLGGVANQTLAILLVPIYANVLGVADYGAVAVINATLSLATMFVTLALPQAFFRSYLQEAGGDAERAAVLGTTLGLRLLVSAIGLVALMALAPLLTLFLFGGTDQLLVVALIGPIVFCDTLNMVPLSFLRAERRPAAYSMLSFSRAVLGSILIILFVVGFQLGILGVLLGSVISAVVVAGSGMAFLARVGRLKLALERPLVRQMLVFSLPLVPASIAGWTLNVSDRYLVQAFQGHSAVGVYAAGYTIGLAINALAVGPFTLAWGAAFWEVAKSENAREAYARVMTGFVVFGSLIALAISALATDGLRLLFRPEFEAGRFVVPFSAFAYVCYGIYSIGATGLNLVGRTRPILATTGIAAAINVLMNLILIPILGYMGAAVSTLASYALLAVSTTWASERHYPVPWDLPRIIGAMAVGMGLAAAALLGPDHIVWRIACLGAYLPIMVTLGVIRSTDLAALRQLLRLRRR